MALQATVKASVSATLTSAPDLATVTAKIADSLSIALTNGTGAGQADLIWQDTRTLAASATENLDLSGALTSALGAAVVFARIKFILVTAAAANTNNVNVIREGTNGVPLFLALADGIAVRPGGFMAWGCTDATGVAVTASTGDLLTITNSGGTTGVTYNITIIGCSA
jgi:hypothetical protein